MTVGINWLIAHNPICKVIMKESLYVHEYHKPEN